MLITLENRDFIATELNDGKQLQQSYVDNPTYFVWNPTFTVRWVWPSELFEKFYKIIDEKDGQLTVEEKS
jgi:hypothetical protein